ncbi:DUF2000 family protein [Denitrobaculum tricleocarpae]|uniref:DUF2000 family protein n=1 Tax=Denitrobaculum tricleocarpae TaxID=2591009 RepID=A0A545TFX2_9PROT|nr:DUF2000 family protein [Denitrobaculum tricleocarpae]TQV76120.1 DUF2000 family protein [Denitrobaculum tricleocarpae]
MFDTKIAIVVREDLAVWQKLNVTAFLTSGVLGADQSLLGEAYRDADGQTYSPLIIQPVIVLSTDGPGLTKIHNRALNRGARLSLYIEEMFATGHDAANRAAVRAVKTEDLKIVGLALREERKLVDKVTKGAKMHA